MLQSDASDKNSSNEDESCLQELESEGEMTSTTSSSLEDLNEKIGKLLDKLTTHNCEEISRGLLVYFDSLDKIKIIVRIMFEKAVSGENNASTYANLFKHISARRRVQMKQEVNVLFFRKCFLRMCQTEFEKDRSANHGVDANLIEIVREPSEEKRKELRIQLVNHLQMLRMRSVAVSRFLGELYVAGALNTAIITVCIDHLLESEREQDLECFCVLMKIIGKVLEEKTASSGNPNIKEYFHKMNGIINEEKTSSDVRSMWKEVILLKNNGWISMEGPTAESGIKVIQLEETNKKVQSSDETTAECNLPKNDLKSIPLFEDKENKIVPKSVGDEKILSSTVNTTTNSFKNIDYEEGQWSPVNPLGKKKYGREFLLRLQCSPLSVKIPNFTVKADCILQCVLKRILSTQNRKLSLSEPVLKSNPDLERDLAQNAVILDIKSKETETTGEHSSEIAEDVEEPEVEDEESIKLKKATEEIVACLKSTNRDEVALQIMKLQIINAHHLKAVVSAIFEQAVNKTYISETFAGLCLYLNNANFGWQAMIEVDPNDNLKKSLLEGFRKEFRKNAVHGTISVYDLQLKLRLRGVTTFFGHLYKIGMIPDPMLVMGIKSLLSQGDEYSLEILCNLISQRKPVKKD